MFLTSTSSAAIMLEVHGWVTPPSFDQVVPRDDLRSRPATAAMMKPSLVVVTRILSQIWSQLHRFALIAL